MLPVGSGHCGQSSRKYYKYMDIVYIHMYIDEQCSSNPCHNNKNKEVNIYTYLSRLALSLLPTSISGATEVSKILNIYIYHKE